jgi:hypothetical protein
MWGALSDERMGLSFSIATGLCQRSLSRVRVSDWRLPQPGGPGPRIYIPQGQDGSVIPPGNGFIFHRLIRLARVQWRY